MPQSLPSSLNRAATQESGGGITLVIGAGCSIESPTGLDSAASLSQKAHDRLVDDEIISGDQCNDPEDLSELAEVVYQETGSQEKLVSRLRPAGLRNATPNEGHEIAAALMLEQAIGAIITLNFDHALSTALANLGAGSEVQEIAGPEVRDEIGLVNLIYLHRKASAPPDNWILRKEAIEKEWEDNWEEAMVSSNLLREAVVFAGLGSPVAVLTTSAKRMKEKTGLETDLFQVDVEDYDNTGLTADLEIEEEAYINLGWCDFMRLLAARVLREQMRQVKRACHEHFSHQEVDDCVRERIENLCGRLEALELVRLGQLRSKWLLVGHGYHPHRKVKDDLDNVASLIELIDLFESHNNIEAGFRTDGTVLLSEGKTVRRVARIVHARGKTSWEEIDAKVKFEPQTDDVMGPNLLIAAGVTGAPPDISPPDNLIDTDTSEGNGQSLDVVEGVREVTRVSREQLMNDPDLTRDVLAWTPT